MVKFEKGKHFEEKIVQAIIVDQAFAEQVLEILDVEYFNVEYLKALTKCIFDFYGQYKTFPTFKTLLLYVKDNVESEVLLGQIIQYLTRIKQDPLNGDADYIKSESLDFCKRRALALAMEESLNLITEKKFEQIVPIIQKALVAGSEREIGHVLLDEEFFKQRMAEVSRRTVPLPWLEVNNVTQGGMAGGELWVVAASAGMGKTRTLVNIGASAAENKFNVVHYSFEIDCMHIAKCYDSNYSQIPIDNLQHFQGEVKKSLEKVQGKVIIKSYPCKSATALTLKSHIHKLTMQDLKPDLVIVDYGDLMRSRKNYDQKRFEEEAIYEDLRNLAGELNLPVLTATQLNRASLDEEVLTLKHVAECFQKAMIADVFITMYRKKQNSVETPGNFYIAKSRLGPDGIKFNMLANTSTSSFRIVSDDELHEADTEETSEERLKRRLIEFKKKDLE